MRALLRSACLLALAGLLVLASLPPPARAGNEPPSSVATAYNTQRKLVRSEDGTLYAAIAVNASGQPEVRVLSTRDGVSWASLPHPSLTGNWSDRASLAIDSLGRLHLVWTEPVGGNRQVFYSRYQDGAWTPMARLSNSTGYAGYPAIAVDAQDAAHVVWYGFDGTVYQIYYRRLGPAAWTPEEPLTHESVDATNPSIALGPGGDVYVAWFRQNRNATYDEVAYLHVVGGAVQETEPVSTPGVDSTDPTIAVAPDGAVHVAWSARVGNVDRIEDTSRAPGASAWSPVEEVSPGTVGGQDPSLALDGLGRLHVVWASTSGGIYAQALNGTWSVPVLLSSATGNSDPSVRWSQDYNPLCGGSAALDVVWTHGEAGAYSLGYASIPAPVRCPAPPPPAADPTPWVLGGALAAAVVAGAAVLAWRRRRWYPKPPRGGD